MIKISKHQANQRYDTLPEILKDALFSLSNAEEVSRICQLNHLPPEIASMVAMLVGQVILGFIHPDDLVNEIRSNIDINPQIADSVVKEIDRKIFTPIRNDLLKIYKPLISEEERLLVAEIKKPVEKTEIEIPGIEPKIVTAEEEIKIPETKEEIQISEKKPAVAPPEGLPMATEAEPPVVSPSTELGAGEDGPLIIHKEIEIRPPLETKKPLGGLFGFLKKKDTEAEKEITPVRAKIETGIEAEKEEIQEITGKTKPPEIRVVHYTDFRTPFAPAKPSEPSLRELSKPPKEEIPVFKKESEIKEVGLPLEPKMEPKPEEKPSFNLNLKKPESPPIKPEEREEEVIDLREFEK